MRQPRLLKKSSSLEVANLLILAKPIPIPSICLQRPIPRDLVLLILSTKIIVYVMNIIHLKNN